MNVWIISKLHNAWPVWINLNVGPSVRLFDNLNFICQIIPAVRCRLNYTLQVSKLRLLKIKLLPAGPRVLSEIIRGCWWSYFNSRTMLTRKVCTKVYAVHPEITRGEVPRIRYPVTWITYLKTFCVKRINLVHSLNVSYLPYFSAGEIVDPRILIIYESNKIFLLLRTILAFIFGIFTLLFYRQAVKKVIPYFRENESSEASG
jgi:hypothetical protein